MLFFFYLYQIIYLKKNFYVLNVRGGKRFLNSKFELKLSNTNLSNQATKILIVIKYQTMSVLQPFTIFKVKDTKV